MTEQTKKPGAQPDKDANWLKEYRQWLVQVEHKTSESYDKSIMALSGGALALSITFIHDVVKTPDPSTVWLLGLGWLLLVVSIVSILASILTGQIALQKAIRQVDDGSIYKEVPGGRLAGATQFLNILAAIAFTLGIVSLAIFSLKNL